MKSMLTVRRVLILLTIVLVILIARPVSFLMYTYLKDEKATRVERTGYTNDASNLNETKVQTIIKTRGRIEEATEQISELVKQARAEGKNISIAGAQHSMGGHTIYPNGIVLDMKGFNYMKLDSANNTLLVGSGSLWSDVIPYLDKKGKSIAVMQSNNSFSVGGSVSVNCHGWQPNSPPVASTVKSFRLINADGRVVECSRDKNRELFSLALGGYGLFGVILDIELKVVDNELYKFQRHLVNSSNYIKEFNASVSNANDVGMAYGRININPINFMEEAILSTFKVENGGIKPSLQKSRYGSLRRTVFRGSVNSRYGKNLRWKMEKFATSQMAGKSFSRNQLLNEGVEVFQNAHSGSTDILHEYFIPKDSVAPFIKVVKQIIPTYKVDLLNITIRNVKRDDDTFLRYANEEVFGFVMLFNQEKGIEAETEMQLLTRKLIDVAIAFKGTYYLPYRLHATKEQMHKAYPQAQQFFLLKKKYDPAEIFRNQFYDAYK